MESKDKTQLGAYCPICKRNLDKLTLIFDTVEQGMRYHLNAHLSIARDDVIRAVRAQYKESHSLHPDICTAFEKLIEAQDALTAAFDEFCEGDINGT